jgi:hypothetical protein
MGSMHENAKRSAHMLLASVILVLGFSSGNSNLSANEIIMAERGSTGVQGAIVKEASKYLGVPYAAGGVSNKGFDCSGLIYRVFHDASKIDVPRIVTELAGAGVRVEGSLSEADIVLFDTDGKGKPSHAGISLGGQRFIHAASAGSKRGVIVSSLSEDYYKTRYLGARRIIRRAFPLVRVLIDNAVPATRSVREGIEQGFPVYVEIKNIERTTILVRYRMFRDGKLVVSKRMKLSYNDEAVRTWFIPDSGEWSLTIEDDRDREIVGVRFY